MVIQNLISLGINQDFIFLQSRPALDQIIVFEIPKKENIEDLLILSSYHRLQ